MALRIYDESEKNRQHNIAAVRTNRVNGDIEMEVKFGKGKYFLCFVYNIEYQNSINIEEICNEIDTDDILSNRYVVYKDDIKGISVLNYSRSSMMTSRIRILKNDIRDIHIDNIPLVIAWYAVDINNNGQAAMYRQEGTLENQILLPLKLTINITEEKKSLFDFSNKKRYRIELPQVSSYYDKAVYYTISGFQERFYLTKECFGKELYLEIPQNKVISIRANNDSDTMKYYIVKINDD